MSNGTFLANKGQSLTLVEWLKLVSLKPVAGIGAADHLQSHSITASLEYCAFLSIWHCPTPSDIITCASAFDSHIPWRLAQCKCMPHWDHLNVLANIFHKPITAILNKLSGALEDDSPAGDVRYHLGANYIQPTPSGKKVSLSLVANPLHLKAKDPVIHWKMLSIQNLKGDYTIHNTTMAVLLHGDAAFAGQDVVYETMGFHNLPNYRTSGTIHLIINNQIKFTTDPCFSHSMPYPSDITKSIDAPVNNDNVEAMNFVCQLTVDYHAKYM